MILHTPPYKAPIAGPGVWSGSDFSGPSDYWYYLSQDTLAELDLALQRIRRSGKTIFSLTAQDFPLPSFENDAEALREELPQYLDRLYAPYHVDRRAELPPGESPTLPVPVFAHDGRLSVRYLRFYITKGHEVAGAPLTAADTEPLDYMDDVMRRPNLPVT